MITRTKVLVLIVTMSVVMLAWPYLPSTVSSANLLGGRTVTDLVRNAHNEETAYQQPASYVIVPDNTDLPHIPYCVEIPGFGVVCREP